MDPNECLKELLELCSANCEDPSLILYECMERAGELFSILDRWISTGGFLPKLWQVEPDDGIAVNTNQALVTSNLGYTMLTTSAAKFVESEGCCARRLGLQFFRAFLKFHGLLVGGAPLPTPWKKEIPT